MSKIQKLNNRTLALGIKHLKKVDSDFKEILRDRNDQIILLRRQEDLRA